MREDTEGTGGGGKGPRDLAGTWAREEAGQCCIRGRHWTKSIRCHGEQDLNFNKIPEWILCSRNFAKHWEKASWPSQALQWRALSWFCQKHGPAYQSFKSIMWVFTLYHCKGPCRGKAGIFQQSRWEVLLIWMGVS